jgi:SAM-dependent methyltransferase
MNIAQRIGRRLYDLAVRLRLSPYRRLWLMTPADWDKDYASGSLDYYGDTVNQARLQVLIGIIKSFPRRPRILDIGCGVGTLRARIHDDDIAEYVGLDISEIAIAAARAHRFPNTSFRVAERPLSDEGAFDIIMLTDMLCYVVDVPGLLESLKPSMAPDGWLVNLLFRHAGDVALHRQVEASFCKLDKVYIARNVAPQHAWLIGTYGLSRADAAMARNAPAKMRSKQAG